MRTTRLRVTITTIGISAALALLLPFGEAAAQPQPPLPDTPSRMRLDIDALNPRVITADTPAITVTGTVTNTGDRRIDNVRGQLLRGEPLDTEQELTDARNQPTESARSPFVGIGDGLQPGQSAPLTLTVPVHGGEGSLKLEKPGVYPLLVNVNGRPEHGGQARLATASVLLPVLGVPGGTAPAKLRGKLTVIWPLIDDYPRKLADYQGQALLADDGLANSLAPGGRLSGLLGAVTQAAANDPELLEALCFAVDPDLLETAAQMAEGYQVRDANGQISAGKGAAAAKSWLEKLRLLVAGQCVIAVPYADADLVALSRAGAVDLQKLALAGQGVVAEKLGLQPLRGVHWPVGGTLDQRTLADLAGSGPTTVLVDPARLRRPEGTVPYVVGEPASAVHALPIDTLVSAFLATGPAFGPGPSGLPASQPDEREPSVQSGLAALTYRMTTNAPSSPMLIAPPRRWAAPASELGAFLQNVQYLFANQLAEPLALGDLVSAEPGGASIGLDYTPTDGASEIVASATAEVDRINKAQRDLLSAMGRDDTNQVEPQTLVTPIQFGLLRATSSAWRGRGPMADRAVAEVASQLDGLLRQVTITNPGRPHILASGSSPVPVFLSNQLPVSIRVRVNFGDTPGLRPQQGTEWEIPARAGIYRYVPAEVSRAGRFTVDVSLTTPGNTALGTTTRLELTSTSYGSLTLILTGTAAGALFLLAGFRIFRRVRAAKAAPAGDTPEAPAEDGAD